MELLQTIVMVNFADTMWVLHKTEVFWKQNAQLLSFPSCNMKLHMLNTMSQNVLQFNFGRK